MDLEARQQDGLRVLWQIAETQAMARLQADLRNTVNRARALDAELVTIRDHLAEVKHANGNHRALVPGGAGVHNDSGSGPDGGARAGDKVRLAQGKVTPGALKDFYDIPTVTFHRRPVRGVILTSILLIGIFIRFSIFVERYTAFLVLAAVWAVPFISMIFQWIASWFDLPATVTDAEAEQLAKLNVVVNIPCYNEDVALLDRALFALVNQSRLPNRVDVVDDGSKINYDDIKYYWTQVYPGPVEIRWVRQPNGGKKRAQGNTFAHAPEADVFAIMDSDTCLEHHALEEALKPLIKDGISSVAGIEMPMNPKVNWLTRTVGVRSAFFQFLPCAAQSAIGDVLINRGAFFLIRAQIVRDALPAYLEETFWGRPIKLGDDAALTLFAQAKGKTVQQSTSFAMTMYPETLSHHLRQWLRWMRGSTTRTCWRLRYLSPLRFSWWFSVMGVYSFIMSTLFPVLLIAELPRSGWACLYVLVMMILWSYIYGLRTLCTRRSDETRWYQVGSLLSYPVVLLWGLFVLRPIRVYGTFTFLNQGWTTRHKGAEVTLSTAAEESVMA